MCGHYSNQNKSRYSHRRPPRNEALPSINRSYVKSGINPSMQQQQITKSLATSQVVPDSLASGTTWEVATTTALAYSSVIVAWRDLSHNLHNFHLLKAEPYFWAVTCNCTDFHFGLNSVDLFYEKRFWTRGLEQNSFVGYLLFVLLGWVDVIQT